MKLIPREEEAKWKSFARGTEPPTLAETVAYLHKQGYRIVRLKAWDDVMYEYSMLPWCVADEL